MITFERLPELIAARGDGASELATLCLSATAKSVGGVLATRCAFEVMEHLEADGFDVLRCRDACHVGLPIPGPFALVCVDTSGLATERDAQQRMGAVIQRLKYEDLHVRPVILIGTSDMSGLKVPMRMSETRFTPVTLEKLVDLLLARPPRDRLVAALVANTLLRELNPYIYKGPVHGSMFVGRRRELQWFASMKASYALVGPRTMGKSSLVHRAAEIIIEGRLKKDASKDRSVERMVILTEFGSSMTELEMTREIIRRFVHHYGASEHLLNQASANTVERLVEDYAMTYKRQKDRDSRIAVKQNEILIIIDEADAMAATCPRLAESLRMFHDRGWAKIILVGYKDLRKALNDVRQFPLMNVCQELPLDNASLDECGALVMEPMLQLGITFDDLEKVVRVIHRESGGAPSRIQLLCHHIVNALDDRERRVTPETAANAIRLAPVQMHLRQWYKDSTTPLEKWLAGIGCAFLPCEEVKLHEEARKLFPELSRQAFDTEISDLITANVFAYKHGGQLDFTFPTLREIVAPERSSRESMQTLMQQLRTQIFKSYGGTG